MASGAARRHTRACLEDDRPRAAIPPEGDRDVTRDWLAEFVSEDSLPPRPPLKIADDAPLDAFECEAPPFADPSIPASTSTAGTSPPPDAEGDRRTLFLPAWRSMAAAAGVIILGLLVQPSGDPLFAPNAPRNATFASASQNHPTDLPTTTPSPEANPPASPVEAPVEPDRPLRQGAQAAQAERTVPAAIDGLTSRTTAAGFTPRPSATTGNVMASSASATVDAGIGVVLPAAGAVPGVPPANLPAPLAPDDGVARAAPERGVSSAQDQVRGVLGQFQAAYNRLDAGFVQTIWPSVDRARLERAFRNLQSQDVEFSECRLDVANTTAAATCTGVVEYATRVGNRRSRDARRWTFTLQKTSEGWLIQDVLMR